MMEAVGIAAAVFVPFAGWVLAIQSKVAGQEIQLDAQKELILSKLDDIGNRLGRIERYLNGPLAATEDDYDERPY